MKTTVYDGPEDSRKVWFITGTSSGLGQSLVRVVLARGDNVIATARDVDSIRDFTSNPETAARVHRMKLDVTAPFAELRIAAGEAVAKWGRVDVLVNNAGAGFLGLTEEVGVEGYQKQFDVNFFGPLNVTNAFLPYMRARRAGTIVYIGSRSSWRSNVPMMGTYAASKAALTAATEALAAEVASMNIKILNVLPGGMKTQTWDKMTLLPTTSNALLPPITKHNGTEESQRNHAALGNSSSALSPDPNGSLDENAERHIADYTELRNRQIEWMSTVPCHGDAEKCASAIYEVVSSNVDGEDTKDGDNGRKKNWPELDMLVLGADAETNIRDKCHAVIRNLDKWKDVVNGVSLNRTGLSQ